MVSEFNVTITLVNGDRVHVEKKTLEEIAVTVQALRDFDIYSVEFVRV